MKNNYKVLSNGVKMPSIGYGTYEIKDGDEAIKCVKNAIKVGYRHIDTAAVYGNEKSVGKAVKESGIDRKNLFITSKLWNSEQGYDTTLKAFDKTMKALDMDYLDLYLIHWPSVIHKDYLKRNLETWRAFEKLYKEGKIKSIGVSNFLVHHLNPLMKEAEIKPMVNQIELNPQYQEKEIVQYCQKNNIVVEAWGPLMRGKAFENEVLGNMAKNYNKNISQICIRWSLQKGFVPLPKSVNNERMAINFDVFDFEISKEDMNRLDALDGGGFSGMHPDNVNF